MSARRAGSPGALYTLAWILVFLLAAVGTASAQVVDGALSPPVPLHRVQPTYPAGAAAGAAGDVVLGLTVSATGGVEQADVVESKGPELDAAAIAAAKQWTFSPATRGTRPIVSHIRVQLHFDPPPPPPAPSAATPTIPP